MKKKISVSIEKKFDDRMENEKTNKSKLVNWVLREYYENLRWSDE